MNILLTGAAGQLGCELLPLLSARGRVTATDRIKPDSLVENWIEMDISKAGKASCFQRFASNSGSAGVGKPEGT